MRFILAIVLLVGDMVVAVPTQCNACDRRNTTTCYGFQENQLCATNRNSLGTTHCGSVAIKYLDFPFGDVKYGFYRGCIDCADKKAACFALGGLLLVETFETLLQCDIECCTGGNCNNHTFTLSQNAITVFTPGVAGPTQCQECSADRDANDCTRSQRTQTCDKDSLGTTHCGSAKYKYQDVFGVHDGYIRGCINCADKKAACAAIAGYLKGRRGRTIMNCDIDCCTGKNCNDGADPNLLKCNECFESDATKSKCSRDVNLQTCALDRNSVGTSHCASLAGRYRLTGGTGIQEFFYRGCIDCESKKAACFALGGYFKGKNDDDPLINLLQCEIECCTGNNCNTQVPRLSPNAIDVFTPTASGPKQCNLCFENDAAECTKNQQTAICATDRLSLGTSHCGSAIGRYSDKKGTTSIAYVRGCINCVDKKAACAAVEGFLKRRGLAPMECEIECCTGDNCNTNFPSFSKRGFSTDVAAIPETNYTLLCGLLSLTTAFAEILNHL